MKEEGVIITRDDIAQVSPLKDRKISSDSEDDHPASEGKVTTDAHVVKGKEPVVADTTTTATPKRKRTGKDKVENVVEKKKEKVIKKQRTQKKKA
ncbi:hypothetical protein A2U01_0076258, partial [Trifolium medium]|nr:hypothetical protein [Trifolium medium]